MDVVRVAGDLLELAVVGGVDGSDAAVFAVREEPTLHRGTHTLGCRHCDVGPGGWGWRGSKEGHV